MKTPSRKGLTTASTMAPSTADSGKATIGTAMAFKFGRTEPRMKATGKTTKLVEKVDSSMLTATSTMVTGSMIKQRVTESIRMQTELGMKASGSTIDRMGPAVRLGLTDRTSREIIKTDSSMAKAITFGLMALSIKEAGCKITFTAKVSIPGKTAVVLRASGATTSPTATAS